MHFHLKNVRGDRNALVVVRLSAVATPEHSLGRDVDLVFSWLFRETQRVPLRGDIDFWADAGMISERLVRKTNWIQA